MTTLWNTVRVALEAWREEWDLSDGHSLPGLPFPDLLRRVNAIRPVLRGTLSSLISPTSHGRHVQLDPPWEQNIHRDWDETEIWLDEKCENPNCIYGEREPFVIPEGYTQNEILLCENSSGDDEVFQAKERQSRS